MASDPAKSWIPTTSLFALVPDRPQGGPDERRVTRPTSLHDRDHVSFKQLGIGIDQSTAIEVTAASFKVLGVGHVFIHDGTEQPNGGHYYLMKAGDHFDLKTLTPSAVR